MHIRQLPLSSAVERRASWEVAKEDGQVMEKSRSIVGGTIRNATHISRPSQRLNSDLARSLLKSPRPPLNGNGLRTSLLKRSNLVGTSAFGSSTEGTETR